MLMKFVAKTFTLLASVVLLCSAVPTGNNAVEAGKEPVTNVVASKPEATKSTYSYKELKRTAEEVKGSKLTLKEKISLKLFGKKIASKSAMGGGKSQLIALLLCIFVGNFGL